MENYIFANPWWAQNLDYSISFIHLLNIYDIINEPVFKLSNEMFKAVLTNIKRRWWNVSSIKFEEEFDKAESPVSVFSAAT